MKVKELKMNKCGTCKYYIGGGDWNLCCSASHPTPKEKEEGITFIFGHLCYKDTNACDIYEPKENTKKKSV